MLTKYLFPNLKGLYSFCQRKIIDPEAFTHEKVDQYFLVESRTYEFIIPKLPELHEIYQHEISTPAGVLKKPGIHIFPKSMPEVNKREKFKAVSRKIE